MFHKNVKKFIQSAYDVKHPTVRKYLSHRYIMQVYTSQQNTYNTNDQSDKWPETSNR